MSPKGMKRSLTIANQVNSSFTVTILASPTREERDTRTSRGGLDEVRKELVQKSPFEPEGKFKSHQTMDLVYTVEPRKWWLDMTSYHSFVLNGVKFYKDDFVYVAYGRAIRQQKALHKSPRQPELLQAADNLIARILEIRALDEHHVFARVYWMYSPDELPADTFDGDKQVSGRQAYHGQHELIASNHMDVINVVSVVTRAQVNQWMERDDEPVQNALYWRQVFDCRTSQLSSVDMTKFKTPVSPEKRLAGCTNDECEHWLYDDCLLDDALMSPAETKCDSRLMKQIDSLTSETTESPEPETHSSTEGISKSSPVENGCPKIAETTPYEAPLEATVSTPQVPPAVPPLLPVYLPCKTQHMLFVHLQNILEVACYDFGKRTMPITLQRHGWDCAESVELSRWTEEFLNRQKCFSNTEHIKKPLDKLFRSIANIRHTAVHRRRVCSKGIEKFLLDAETLAVLLEDQNCTRRIAKLRMETQAAVEDLERNKQFLRSRLDETLSGLAAKRAELQHMEEIAIVEMERKDEEHQMLAGKQVEGLLTLSVDSFSSAIDTGEQTITGLD